MAPARSPSSADTMRRPGDASGAMTCRGRRRATGAIRTSPASTSPPPITTSRESSTFTRLAIPRATHPANSREHLEGSLVAPRRRPG